MKKYKARDKIHVLKVKDYVWLISLGDLNSPTRVFASTISKQIYTLDQLNKIIYN